MGTGFSYSRWPLDYVTNEVQVAQQLYDFLQAFIAQYPQYTDRPLYITGESYAGHYVPAIGWKIVDANAQGGQPQLNLQAIAIGNGLVEPLTQYGAYSDFMYNNNMIDDETHDAVNSAYTDTCAPAIQACQATSRAAVRSGLAATGPNAMACILAADTCNAGVVEPLLVAAAARKNHSINVYDIRDQCSHPPLCYDFSDLEAYMALPDVTSALGVDGHAWTECTTSVHVLLTDDWMQNLEVHIPNVLAAGVRVLVYAGNQDFICAFAPSALHACCALLSHLFCLCRQRGGQPPLGGRDAVGRRRRVCRRAAHRMARRRQDRWHGALGAGPHFPGGERGRPHGSYGPAQGCAGHACAPHEERAVRRCVVRLC